ncbi:hypothetical protein ANN_16027 [Periplaneta americana]|uniref:Mos1 transposase HTH domain-containing protein n=1 Tax=Periplaneta americana TaxID=6978 RepID=A0ABQ8SJ42_PERAM|nr:hypothetical protein ANN_16027 [Periplaneta americana]
MEGLCGGGNEPPGSLKAICKQLEVYGADCLDRSNISRWCRFFEEGRVNLIDEARSGRPLIAVTPANVRGIEAAVTHRTAQTLHRLSFTSSD